MRSRANWDVSDSSWKQQEKTERKEALLRVAMETDAGSSDDNGENSCLFICDFVWASYVI